MSSKPIVVVFGATGNQGGSVVRSLLRTNKYAIRGITRDPSSRDSKELIKQGVDMVKGDMSNKEELRRALQDCWAVFCVTNFWDPAVQKNPSLEIEHGKNVTDVAIASGVRHFIFSSLPDTEKMSQGKYKVSHFTQKNKIEQYIRSRMNEMNAIFVYPGCYMTNFSKSFKPRQESDRSVVFSLPLSERTPLPLFDTQDTGEYVQRILQSPEDFRGQVIYMTCGEMTMPQFTQTFTKVTGTPARYERISPEQSKKVAGEEITEMFQWIEDFGYYGPKANLDSAKMVPSTSLEQWLRKNQITPASE